MTRFNLLGRLINRLLQIGEKTSPSPPPKSK